MAGLFVVPTMTGYACSKYAAEAFSDGLRRELETFGVKVVVLEPATMKTGLITFQSNFKQIWES